MAVSSPRLSRRRRHDLSRGQRILLMIWDFLADQGKKRPVLMRGIVGIIAFAFFGYIALAAMSSYIVDGNRASCERGNATRLISKGLASAEFTKAQGFEVLRLNEGKIAEAHLYSVEKEAALKATDGYVAIAEDSGNQTTSGAVTINCTNEWPKPLPWLGD